MNILVTYAGGIAGQSVIKMIRSSKYSKDIKIFGLEVNFGSYFLISIPVFVYSNLDK